MKTINYTDLRSNLAKVIDQVNDNHNPVIITRQNGKPAVLMSLEDYNSYAETAYLMVNPTNAERLNKAVANIRAGKTVSHELIEDEQ